MNICPFKKFKYIFGIPKTGVHSYRILDCAIFDYILTILLAIITTLVTKIPFVLTTILMFIVGIICHILFGVETNTIRFLNINCE